MRVTEKGQVTIPKPIREQLGIRPGSEVRFLKRANGAVEIVNAETAGDAPLRRNLADWLDRIEGTGDSGLTADDVMSMTRDRDDLDRR